MNLENILSISGKPGLYKMVVKTRNGAVAQSLLDGKKITVGPHSNVSALSEIAVYTISKEVPLAEVLNKIKQKYKGKPTEISHKATKDELEAFFFDILQDYDEDRVYPTHIKKIIQWYNILQSNNLLSLTEDSETITPASEEEE